VGAGRGAEGEVAQAVRALRDGAAGVGDADELAGEGRAGGGGEVVEAGRVGEAATAADDVGEGHRADDLGAGRRRVLVDAAGRLGEGVVVDVGELQDLAGRRVDPGAPGADHTVPVEGELPDLGEAAAGAEVEAVGRAGARDVRR